MHNIQPKDQAEFAPILSQRSSRSKQPNQNGCHTQRSSNGGHHNKQDYQQQSHRSGGDAPLSGVGDGNAFGILREIDHTQSGPSGSRRSDPSPIQEEQSPTSEVTPVRTRGTHHNPNGSPVSSIKVVLDTRHSVNNSVSTSKQIVD